MPYTFDWFDVSFRFNTTDWSQLMELARMYGWVPRGTLARRDQPGPGGDDSNVYQSVTADEAADLAAALERALPEVRDYNVFERKPLPPWEDVVLRAIDGLTRAVYVDPDSEFNSTTDDLTLEPFEYFSGGRKQSVSDFIAFCRAGGFVVV